MKEEQIKRINELFRKQKSEGLTETEKKEQKQLRTEYINSIRKNLGATLNSVKIKDENGKITKLKRRGE